MKTKILKQSISLIGLAAFIGIWASTPAFAILGGDQGAGNGGDTLVTQNPDNGSDDPNTITVSPDQNNGVGYFRLVGEPGAGQNANYLLNHCRSNPDGVGPLVASCEPYKVNGDDGNSTLVLNVSVPLPPGDYEVVYAGSNYWFKLQANQRIETPLTKILYPQTLHNAGFALDIASDYTDPYMQSVFLKDLWGLQYNQSVKDLGEIERLAFYMKRSTGNEGQGWIDENMASVPYASLFNSSSSQQIYSSCAVPTHSYSGDNDLEQDGMSVACDSNQVPMAKENYHNLHDQALVQFTGESNVNITTDSVTLSSRACGDNPCRVSERFVLDRAFSQPASWTAAASYDYTATIGPMTNSSFMIPNLELQMFGEGGFYSVLPGTYNAYALQTNKDWIRDDQGKMKVIQHIVVPDRTTSQGAALNVEPLDWLTAPPKPAAPQAPSQPTGKSCFLFFCS